MDLNSKLLAAATAWKEAHDAFMTACEAHGSDSQLAENACGVLADAEDALKDAIDAAPTEALFTSELMYARCVGCA